jgi:hypothetical protein
MGVIVIPTNEYASRASEAETISARDFGYVRAGLSVSRSFRVGNLSPFVQDLSFSTDSPLAVAPDYPVTLQPNEISDTLSVRVSALLDCVSDSATADLIVSDGESTYSIPMHWETVGANSDRRSQVPERTGDVTRIVGNTLERALTPLRLYRFDPVPYDPADRCVFIRDGHPVTLGDPCARLDPLDDRWGYRRSVQTILAAYVGDDWTISESFTRDNTTVSYEGSASLLIPAEYELDRTWALFNPATQVEREQYKRTVYLTQIQGQVWCLQIVDPAYYGEDLAYWTCRLLPLKNATVGDPSAYNPFAFTYEYESDRPYAVFPCRADIRFAELETAESEDPAPVALSLGECSAYLLRKGSEAVQVVTVAGEVAGYTSLSGADWPVNQAVVKRIRVSTDSQNWTLYLLPYGGERPDLLRADVGVYIFQGCGPMDSEFDWPYEDRDSSRSVHCWFYDIDGNGDNCFVELAGVA